MRHARFGQQFKLISYQPVKPSSVTGMERFLSSGAVKGIGKTMAARIVEHFGTETMTVLESFPERLAEVKTLAEANQTAALIVPNFALGAVVMIKLAAEAAKYFPDVEIIEKHHDQKLDAPSGTAILTAQKIAAVRAAHKQGHPEERETMPGARGGDFEGIRIHSMRLPGYVASQEVVFGSRGETLKIINDPVNRECYMPGVVLACKKIGSLQGLIYGLDQIL